MTDDEIRWSRKQDKINAEVQLDGIYVIRTSLQSSALGAPEAVEAYKSLAHVERTFRSLKTAQLAVRPIFVYSEDHVRGHILLCMLAYYVEWHLAALGRARGGGPGGSAGAAGEGIRGAARAQASRRCWRIWARSR